MARWLEAVQAVGMAMVHRSLPIPFAQARICIDSATVTRHAARMMAQAMAAREQCHKHRNREPIDGKVVGGGPGGGHGHGTPLSTNTVRPGSHLH